MALSDDEPIRRPATHQIGQDVSALSLHDFDERIAALEAEIVRLRMAKEAKARSMSAADAVFRSVRTTD